MWLTQWVECLPLRFNPQHHTSGNASTQEEQKFRDTLSYTENLRLAWAA